jgi:hypothetical protein
MSPDIEWQVDEAAGQETIAKTPPPTPLPPSQKVVLALTILLGIGLGVAYHSIPEPPLQLAPTPLATTLPLPLPRVENTIATEAASLATGQLSDFMALQAADDPPWRQTQMGLFRTWGQPANGPLYTIIETGTLPADRVWADIAQFRANQYFRETRFYQLIDRQWRRIAPVSDVAFWGTTQAFQTPHYRVQSLARDSALAHIVVNRFEGLYTRLCGDLQCADPELPTNRKLQVRFQPETVTPTIDMQNDQLIYTLPSPRIGGLYFDTSSGRSTHSDRPGNPSIVASITYYVARASTSGLAGWPPDLPSEQFLQIIAEWERLRYMGRPAEDLLYRPDLLAQASRLDLETLWVWPPTYNAQTIDLIYAESAALIRFIDDQYGPAKVVQFLHTLGQVSTMSAAIDRLGLSYPRFKLAWQAWLKQSALING